MKIRTFGLVALLAIWCLTLAGCNTNENVEMANPASVYCEEQWGTLNLEEGLCMFSDGSYCEEWSYYRDECQPGEIIYNTIDDGFIDDVEQKTDWNGTSEVYSQEDLQSAVDAIMDVVENEWQVKVEMQELFYAGDEESTANLNYCKELANAKWEDVDECAVFTSNFYIPAQDAQMAGAFEPDSTLTGYGWTLGRATAGEWEVLSNGFG